MAGLWSYFVLGIIGLQLATSGADYAQYEAFLTEQSKNATFVRLFEEHLKQFQDNSHNLKSEFEFNCTTYPKSKAATSVHELTPMDIQVIAALGDSITAGTGITAATPLGLLRQDRQLSWSIGGSESIYEQKTLPNIIKQYNPKVTGYSTGWGPVWIESASHLNLADPGDKSEDIPGQAEELFQRMKNADNIDFENDWKMVTLFVGGNDLCKYCDDESYYSAENYVANLQKSLDILHAKFPRTFVNLVQVLDIAIVKKLNANFVCDTLHLFLCSCAAFPKDSEAEQKIQAETERYRKLTEELILSGRYDTRDDFTVVLQPFFSKTLPPNKEGSDEPDLSYFAPDCFHLSLKGHQAATEALWDNLVEPIGKKRTSWSPHEQLDCPSASNPYFYTSKNNGKTPSQSDSDNKSQGAGDNMEEQSDNGDTESLGAASTGDNTEQQSDNDHTGSPQSLLSIPVALLAGAVVALAVVVVVVVRKRKHHRKEEREILLQTDNMRIYNA